MVTGDGLMTYGEAIRKLWKGKCTITEKVKTFDPETKVTAYVDKITVENEPCRVSFGTTPISDITATVNNVEQEIKLFIRQDLVIKEGSSITVTQNGRTQTYEASGKPKIYMIHQEVQLKAEEKA